MKKNTNQPTAEYLDSTPNVLVSETELENVNRANLASDLKESMTQFQESMSNLNHVDQLELESIINEMSEDPSVADISNEFLGEPEVANSKPKSSLDWFRKPALKMTVMLLLVTSLFNKEKNESSQSAKPKNTIVQKIEKNPRLKRLLSKTKLSNKKVDINTDAPKTFQKIDQEFKAASDRLEGTINTISSNRKRVQSIVEDGKIKKDSLEKVNENPKEQIEKVLKEAISNADKSSPLYPILMPIAEKTLNDISKSDKLPDFQVLQAGLFAVDTKTEEGLKRLGNLIGDFFKLAFPKRSNTVNWALFALTIAFFLGGPGRKRLTTAAGPVAGILYTINNFGSVAGGTLDVVFKLGGGLVGILMIFATIKILDAVGVKDLIKEQLKESRASEQIMTGMSYLFLTMGAVGISALLNHPSTNQSFNNWPSTLMAAAGATSIVKMLLDLSNGIRPWDTEEKEAEKELEKTISERVKAKKRLERIIEKGGAKAREAEKDLKALTEGDEEFSTSRSNKKQTYNFRQRLRQQILDDKPISNDKNAGFKPETANFLRGLAKAARKKGLIIGQKNEAKANELLVEHMEENPQFKQIVKITELLFNLYQFHTQYESVSTPGMNTLAKQLGFPEEQLALYLQVILGTANKKYVNRLSLESAMSEDFNSLFGNQILEISESSPEIREEQIKKLIEIFHKIPEITKLRKVEIEKIHSILEKAKSSTNPPSILAMQEGYIGEGGISRKLDNAESLKEITNQIIKEDSTNKPTNHSSEIYGKTQKISYSKNSQNKIIEVPENISQIDPNELMQKWYEAVSKNDENSALVYMQALFNKSSDSTWAYQIKINLTQYLRQDAQNINYKSLIHQYFNEPSKKADVLNELRKNNQLIPLVIIPFLDENPFPTQ